MAVGGEQSATELFWLDLRLFDIIRGMVSPIKQPLPPLSVELIADPDAGGFTARLPDIPAYGEGDTEEEALSDLRSALEGYIQTFGLDDAMSRIVSPQIRSVSWDLKAMSRA